MLDARFEADMIAGITETSFRMSVPKTGGSWEEDP